MRASRFIALLSVAALSLSACGGDDDDDTGASEPAAEEDGGDATDDGDDASDSVDEDDVEDALDAFTSDECAEAYAAMIAAASAVPESLSGQGDDDLETSLDQLNAFADAAPEEIRDDLRTVYEGYARVVEALQDAGFDPESGEIPDADALAELQAIGEELDNAEFQEAAENVSTWFEEECSTE
jgi:hypothetical protein